MIDYVNGLIESVTKLNLLLTALENLFLDVVMA